jgi:hypothetical protein
MEDCVRTRTASGTKSRFATGGSAHRYCAESLAVGVNSQFGAEQEFEGEVFRLK